MCFMLLKAAKSVRAEEWAPHQYSGLRLEKSAPAQFLQAKTDLEQAGEGRPLGKQAGSEAKAQQRNVEDESEGGADWDHRMSKKRTEKTATTPTTTGEKVRAALS